jgi:hypothetical protein
MPTAFLWRSTASFSAGFAVSKEFDSALLHGTRFVIAEEPDEGVRLNIDLMKDVSGRGAFSFRRLLACTQTLMSDMNDPYIIGKDMTKHSICAVQHSHHYHLDSHDPFSSPQPKMACVLVPYQTWWPTR